MKDRLTFSTVLLVALFLVLAPTALASTTWYVDGVHGSDSNNCKSLQTACKTIGHAIALASSGDSIRVAAATYRENLIIRRSLNVVGSGASTTIIDGGWRPATVAFISYPSVVTLSRLTIQHGRSYGGGIYNDGTLTINNSIISSNIASSGTHPALGGGIYNGGTMTINNSTITGNSANGGGIREHGVAAVGGGIYNAGVVLTINNSTITGNSANGWYAQGLGGGINNESGMLTINNSTVSSNSASGYISEGEGGGIYSTVPLTVSNSTFSGNSATVGGAVLNSASTVVLKNSIIANSPSGGNCSGTMTSDGYNLDSDGSCNFNNIGDLIANPMLGPLQNNGGPTQTQALLPGSPAIDAGNPSGCTDNLGHLLKTDQRGMPRPDKEDKTGCDMGAYEKQSD